MSPLRGWGRRGERLVAHTPYGHWKTMTFIAALRHDRVEAPLNGPINGEAFRVYVEPQLVKTLKPGDIVVLDNLGSHKGAMVRNLVRAAGARLFYLPPCSPDLNPIEQHLAKLKHWMRRAAQRSVETVHTAIANVLDAVTPTECRNYGKRRIQVNLNAKRLSYDFPRRTGESEPLRESRQLSLSGEGWIGETVAV